ncbi:MAG: response regulator, partial [Pseudomonadota bacterium]
MTRETNACGPTDGDGKRLLIVDDDEDFVAGLMDILECRGYKVEAAHSASQGEEIIRVFDAQVALLDIRLGVSSGTDLIGRLKPMRPGILCVMMTAYANTDTAVEALQKGAYDYLRKPLDIRELLYTLDRCYERLRLEQDKETALDALEAHNRKLQEVNARLRAIVDTTRNLAACSGLREMGKSVLEEFARNMAAGGGSLYLLENRSLVLVHSLDPSHAEDVIPLPPRQGSVLDRVISRCEPALIVDINKEPDVIGSGWDSYTNSSALVMPLAQDGGEILGVIALHNKEWPPFTEQDLEIARILSSYTCEALRATHAMDRLA